MGSIKRTSEEGRGMQRLVMVGSSVTHRLERMQGSGDVADEAMEEGLPGGCDNY